MQVSMGTEMGLCYPRYLHGPPSAIVKSTAEGVSSLHIFNVPIALAGQVVDYGGGGDRLPCAGWALNQTEGPLEYSLDSIHLEIDTQQLHSPNRSCFC